MSDAGQNFALGAKVYLKTCPEAGEPGTVTGHQQGRIIVHWTDLNFIGRHMPNSLVMIEPGMGSER